MLAGLFTFMKTAEITIGGMLVVPKAQLDNEALYGIKARFTHANPTYHIMQSTGINTKDPQTITSYVESEAFIAVPRGSGTWLRTFLGNQGYSVSLNDQRAKHEPIDFELNFGATCANGKKFESLYDYQNEAIDYLARKQQGIFQADCGAGKTVLGIGLIAKVKQPCVVIVHTNDLAQQWLREITEKGRGTARVGMVGLGERNPGDITIATVQTLYRMGRIERSEFMGQFGMLIQDECFPAGTSIEGTPIEDIKVGDLVTAFNEKTGEFVKMPVVRLFKTKPRSMVRLRLSNGKTITCTANHPFYTEGGEYVDAKDLHNLRVAIPRELQKPENVQ